MNSPVPKAAATAATAPPLEQRVRQLAGAFQEAGHRLYLVGGSLRDRMLGRPVHDVDLTTDATPDEIRRLVKRVRPDAVYDIGAKFGTIGIIFHRPAPPAATPPEPSANASVPATDGLDTTGDLALSPVSDDVVEITTFRSEAYVDGTRKPVVAFGTSLEEDLARRDFTMNAMAQDLVTDALYDPFNGAGDIGQRLIRAVGDAPARFRDDPLRLLRAVRFAAQLGFTIDPETLAAMRATAPELERISKERIQEELTRILVSPRPAMGLRLATELGLIGYAIPEVLPMRGVSQRPLHHKDVFEHTMGVVENIPADTLLRWAALLHDIGKPRTKSVQEGEVHFFGHEDVGERMARVILRRLHLDSQFIERVAKLVRMHLRVNSYDSTWTDSAVRRLMREAGDELEPLIHLSRADVTSYRQDRVRAATMRADEFARRCQELLAQEDVAKLHSPLDGNELMTLLNRPPGPWIKPIKEYLLDLVLDGELDQDNKDRATELAREFIATQNQA
ncbi:MAG: CCA tRNA nucleotidyltransferase [Chloroflexota bacterium]|nr:CCA tRNA nucleotidyltransferase [Chloroflexota bacterium]